jgi:hypothetical protein
MVDLGYNTTSIGENMETITLKSRYGKVYSLVPVDKITYKFEGDTMYCRFGGKENQTGFNYEDLGFFDPDGGPFISVGYKIGDKKVVRIMSRGEGVFFEVA